MPRYFAACAAVALASVATLLRPCAADSLDVSVRLYRDPNCFERVDELILLDNGCYANIYSNLTKAYSFKVTGFNNPQSFLVNEYSDACNTPFSSKTRTVNSGQCVRFVGEGGLYAYVSMRLRSPICVGQCSTIKVAIQTFFYQAACQGLAYEMLYFPLQNECLRWSNGTRTFTVDRTNNNITEVDYIGDDTCSRSAFQRVYSITNRACYPLYTDRAPMSFSWVVDIQTPSTSGTTSRRLPLAGVLAASALNLAAVFTQLQNTWVWP